MAELGIEIPKGSPGGIEAGAASLRSVGGSLERVRGGLMGSGSVAAWQGTSALGYSYASTMEAHQAGYAAEAMGVGAQALVRAAHALEAAQRVAREALEQAREADRRRQSAVEHMQEADATASSAQGQIDAANAAAAATPGPNPAADAARSAAATALDAAVQAKVAARRQLEQAEQEIELAQRKARRAKERWNDEANRTGAELAGLGSPTHALAFGYPRPGVGPGGGMWASIPLPLTPPLLSRAERRAIREEYYDDPSTIDVFHTVLDIGGMVPVAGAVFDGANAAIYKIEGRNREALLALAAAIPGIGDAGKAAKWADEVGGAAKGPGRHGHAEATIDEHGKLREVRVFDENGKLLEKIRLEDTKAGRLHDAPGVKTDRNGVTARDKIRNSPSTERKKQMLDAMRRLTGMFDDFGGL